MEASYTTLIGPFELKQIIDHPKLRLFDCRFNLLAVAKGYEDFKLGHIKNSQYADLNKQLAGPVTSKTGRHPLPCKHDFESQLQTWGVDASSQVVVYDDASGAIASRMWWLCRWAGIHRVAVLDGGLKCWLASDGDLSKRVVKFEKTGFQANYNDQLWVSTETVEQYIGDPGILITDARAYRRYTGESEPIDIKAGHVPGAVNLPFENNLASGGQFLSKQQLSGLHSQSPDISQVISMCGSGVTACHNILARAHVQLDPGKLYVGSWSEWIVNPAHQIATGINQGNIEHS